MSTRREGASTGVDDVRCARPDRGVGRRRSSRRVEGATSSRRPRPPARGAGPRRPAERADRRSLGHATGRCGRCGPHVRRRTTPLPRAGPAAACAGNSARHRGTRICGTSRPGRGRRLGFRADGRLVGRHAAPSFPRTTRRRSRDVARARLCRLRRDGLGAKRTRTPRAAPAGRRRTPGGGPSDARSGGRRRPRTRRARHRASVARGRMAASRARALPLRQAGRVPRCAAARAGTARGRARNRPVSGAATTGNRCAAAESEVGSRPRRHRYRAGLYRRGHSLRAGRRRRLARPTRVRGEPAAQPRGDRRRRTDRGPRATTRNDHRSGETRRSRAHRPGDRELRRTGRLGTFRRSRAGCTRRRRRPARAGRPSRRQRQRAVPAAGGRRDGVAWHPRPGRRGCRRGIRASGPSTRRSGPAGTCPERSLHAVVPPLRPCTRAGIRSGGRFSGSRVDTRW